jgi:hypothetical protein
MRWISGFCLFALFYALVFTQLFGNLWLLLTGKGYQIPRESSVLWFRPTLMDEGLGDMWIYGEDDQFYYFVSDGGRRYKIYPKEKAKTCRNFNPISYDTWCP